MALASGTGFSSSGYGWLKDAHVLWTSASAGGVGGITWYSGYGTYASGTGFYEAHESYLDSGITPTAYAVLYKITHYNSSSQTSAPAHFWYYYPPLPASQDHCVVVVNSYSDLGVEPLTSACISCYMADDTQVTDYTGYSLLSETSASKALLSDAFGLTCFQCYKNSRRSGKGGGADNKYTFVISGCSHTATYTVTTIPDRDWVLLKDIVDA